MGDCVARIERLANGYEVEVLDPKQQEANRKPKAQWKDPWKCYGFGNAKDAAKFLTEHLDSLPVEDESYGASFNEAVAADKD